MGKITPLSKPVRRLVKTEYGMVVVTLRPVSANKPFVVEVRRYRSREPFASVPVGTPEAPHEQTFLFTEEDMGAS
jgi:hypothetical protein